MKKWIVAAAALVIIVGIPAAYAASPKSTNAQAQGADNGAAAKACKTERGTTAQSIEAFKNTYGTNHNKANAFGKCVSGKSKSKDDKDEKAEDDDKNEKSSGAAKACKAERGTTAQSIEAFKNKYGTNHNKANAFGKCVSGKSKSKDKDND